MSVPSWNLKTMEITYRASSMFGYPHNLYAIAYGSYRSEYITTASASDLEDQGTLVAAGIAREVLRD